MATSWRLNDCSSFRSASRIPLLDIVTCFLRYDPPQIGPMRRTRESAASPPAVLVRAASCRSARLPVRCSGLGQPGNGLLKVLDRRPHLDRRSMLASRPGRVTPARRSAAAGNRGDGRFLRTLPGRKSQERHRHLDDGSVSAGSMLTSPSSALIDSSRISYRSCTRRRPSLQQQGPCSPLRTQENMERRRRRCVTSHRLRRLARAWKFARFFGRSIDDLFPPRDEGVE